MRRFYCVLGDPVAHSRSPAIHARAFAGLGLDAVYAPCRVSAADLPAAIAGLRALGCAGFNVTVPHKTAVAGLVDRLEGDAARIGAVNCVLPGGETELVRRARKRGLRAVDGIDVLVHQAIASLEIWLGRTGLSDLFPTLREAALS